MADECGALKMPQKEDLLFTYPVHLSSFWCEMSIKARFARRWNQKGSKTQPKSLHKAAVTPKIGFPPLLYGVRLGVSHHKLVLGTSVNRHKDAAERIARCVL